jgi:hypothetical protein
MSGYVVVDTQRWERLSRAIAEVRRSLDADSAEDVALLIFARAVRDGVIAREGSQPRPRLYVVPSREAAE